MKADQVTGQLTVGQLAPRTGHPLTTTRQPRTNDLCAAERPVAVLAAWPPPAIQVAAGNFADFRAG